MGSSSSAMHRASAMNVMGLLYADAGVSKAYPGVVSSLIPSTIHRMPMKPLSHFSKRRYSARTRLSEKVAATMLYHVNEIETSTSPVSTFSPAGAVVSTKVVNNDRKYR